MTWWIYFLCIYGTVILVVDMAILTYRDYAGTFLNPIIIYKNYNVNIFGCIMLTIGGHLLCPWIAPFYWFYKLCTVGRKRFDD